MPHPNVLLVTIDTFRADRLNARATPNLVRLAEGATVFDAARAAVPLTLPSHATILTGLLPQHHGVRENGLDRLAPDHPTLAAAFKAAGYRTGAFVGAFVLDRRFGLSRGFDEYDDRIARDPNAADRLEAERPANTVVDAALAWLSQHPAPSIPFFAWIHLYDPHAPYTPPAEYRSRAASAYDGEVMFADAELARVWKWLDDARLGANTIVVVAGDHGEGLGDHGERTHGMLLYDATLRVPLIVSTPGRPPSHRADAVTLADIAPTLLQLAHVSAPAPTDGRDLFDAQAARTLYSETTYPRIAGWSALQALTDGRWMAIRSDTSIELYDVQQDPGEQRDVANAQGSTLRAMTAKLDAQGVSAAEDARREVPADTAERLRSLGYVAGSPLPTPTGRAPSPAAHIADWNAFEDALAALNAGDRAAVGRIAPLARAHPDAMLFATTLARAEQESGDLASALATYRHAAQRWPTEATLLHDLAVAAAEAAAGARGSAASALSDEAARSEQAALALRPDYAAAHNGLGLLAAKAGRDRDAAAEFGRATALDPTNPPYWTNLGNARRALGDAPGAEQAYTRALDADPRASDAANGLGALRVAAGRPAEAATWFQRALDADPSSVDARLNLGIALQQSGNTQGAIAQYRAVLQAPPKYVRQRDAAARLMTSLGAAR